MDGMTPFDGSTSDVTYPLQDAMPDGSPFLLSGLVFGDFNEAGSFVGVFYPPGTTEPPWCATTAYGACWVYDCPLPGMLDGGPPAQPQAGILTLTGPDLGGGQDLDAASNVYEYYSPSLIFSPGDMLGVSASGADVPAFGPWTIAGPGAVTVNAPAVPTDGGDIVLPTESDLTVSWTGGQAGSTVILELSSGFRNEGSSEILCQWPATDGTGTIPAAALATLLSPVPQATGSMVWYEANEMDYQAGSWKIQLWAENGGFVSATYQ
jgi:hypothetical protein